MPVTTMDPKRPNTPVMQDGDGLEEEQSARESHHTFLGRHSSVKKGCMEELGTLYSLWIRIFDDMERGVGLTFPRLVRQADSHTHAM